jgi:hypothetical protein
MEKVAHSGTVAEELKSNSVTNPEPVVPVPKFCTPVRPESKVILWKSAQAMERRFGS